MRCCVWNPEHSLRGIRNDGFRDMRRSFSRDFPEKLCWSSGSACAVGRHEAPGTLLAMGYDPAVAKSAIRMTFREPLTLEQINQIASVVEESCNSLRGASTVSDPSINVQAQQALA